MKNLYSLESYRDVDFGPVGPMWPAWLWPLVAIGLALAETGMYLAREERR